MISAIIQPPILHSYTECPLPPLSVLLENERIRDTDSFVICVQIHCPVGPFFPHQPAVSYVPKDLLDGVEALLDNASELSSVIQIAVLTVYDRYRRCTIYLSRA